MPCFPAAQHIDSLHHAGLSVFQQPGMGQTRFRRHGQAQRPRRLLDAVCTRDAAQPPGLLTQDLPSHVKPRYPTQMRAFQNGGGPQTLERQLQIEGFRPIDPFRTVNGGERLDGDPGHAQRVSDDDAVQSLADQHAAAGDGGDDCPGIIARIDQRGAGQRRGLPPGAADGAFEMRHETDVPVLPRGHRTGQRQQRGRIAQTQRGRQTEQTRGALPPHPAHMPGFIKRDRRLIPAITGTGDQFQPPRIVPAIEDGADAKEMRARLTDGLVAPLTLVAGSTVATVEPTEPGLDEFSDPVTPEVP